MRQISYLITNFYLLPDTWEKHLPLESLKAYYLQRKVLEAADGEQ